MTTHKIDQRMVREVIPVFEKYPDIEILDITDEFIWLKHDNMPAISFTQMGLKCIADNKGIYNVGIFDIHRFKDMAIEWCETKGYQIYVGGGEATIKSYGEILEIIGWTDEEDEHNSRLSAELAAIDFVYKQIQKEGK